MTLNEFYVTENTLKLTYGSRIQNLLHGSNTPGTSLSGWGRGMEEEEEKGEGRGWKLRVV